MSREIQSQNPRPAAEGAEPYDTLVARLEKVVGELESGTLSLEQSIEKFAEGIRLAREASRKLDEAERRVEVLVKDEAGDERTEPFEPEGEKGRER